MAQERARRTRGLARRFGLAARIATGVALAAVLAGSVAVAALVPGGVTIERGDGAADAAESPEGRGDDGSAGPGAAAVETMLVHVDGAVMSPGVYELEAGARVIDAVERAGGLAEGADTSALNLAAPVSDGEKIRVPLVGEASDLAGSTGSGAASGQAASLVNINTAGIEELDQLPGIGEATARAIVEDREANGPFAVPEDLMRVSGIGEKKYAQLEGLICV